jgi:acetyl-CoA carboxylase carboxyl transferase subunit alpha
LEILQHEKQIYEYEEMLSSLKEQEGEALLFGKEDIARLEKKLEKLKKKVYSGLTPWQRVSICRHASRPKTTQYIENICDTFSELSGDRLFGDDTALIGGLAKIGGMKCVLIGNEKGCDTESRVYRNFGMLHPEGFRKSLRLMRMAEKFRLPIVSIIDTPGAFPGLTAEERGQGWAIAENLREMSRISTPIIVVVIGEGGSGGALGTAVGDTVVMLEHAYYSVISPEGCASILWKDATKNVEAASNLKFNSEDLIDLGIIDEVIPEPLGGAHHDPESTYAAVKESIISQWNALKEVSPEVLLERRYMKFRRMGKYTVET